MTPVLILTRPEHSTRRFLEQVTTVMGYAPETIIAPMLRIDPVLAVVPNDVAGIIFTSENAVAQVGRLGLRPGLPAFCVGDRTAEAAQASGFEARSAQGDAVDLIAMLSKSRPQGPLVHLHGRKTRGDVAQRLTAAGMHCDGIICYDQTPLAPQAALVSALNGKNPVVLPLFSPNSATILAGSVAAPLAKVHVVAISAAAGAAASTLATAGMTVTDRPDGASMIAATCAALAAWKQGRST